MKSQRSLRLPPTLIAGLHATRSFVRDHLCGTGLRRVPAALPGFVLGKGLPTGRQISQHIVGPSSAVCMRKRSTHHCISSRWLGYSAPYANAWTWIWFAWTFARSRPSARSFSWPHLAASGSKGHMVGDCVVQCPPFFSPDE